MRVVCLFVLALLALSLSKLNHGYTRTADTQKAFPAGLLKHDATASNWPCFRGTRYGVADSDDAPIFWDVASGKGVLWKTPLGLSGINSPIIWGDRVFLTSGSEQERAVLAFDANTGKQLWKQVVPDGGKGLPMPSYSNSGLALTTAACDAQNVYALFGTGDLVALSHDGTPKWHIFLKRPVIGYGYSSSPCLLNDLVCVQLDDHTGGIIYGIEAATGKPRWTVDRSRGASWSSPMTIPGASKKIELVVNANGSITGYDADGKMVWDADGVTGEVTPSPIWWEGKLYLVHGGSGLLCYEMITGTEPKKLWEFHGMLCDVASPVIDNGLLFMAVASGTLVCVDALTGKEVWNHDGPGCYASPVVSGKRVYFLGRDGTILIVAAERSYRELANCPLDDGSDATPAISAGRIYVRTKKYLWCLGER